MFTRCISTDEVTKISISQTNYGSYFISDFSLGYQFGNGVHWTVGIDNLFDRGLPGISTGTTTAGASYDNVGQFFYTTVSYKM